jgi:putative transposase
MKKSRFSEDQIVGILNEVEMGAKVAETCRKRGLSELIHYSSVARTLRDCSYV